MWFYVQPFNTAQPVTQRQVEFSQFNMTFQGPYQYNITSYQINGDVHRKFDFDADFGYAYITDYNNKGVVVDYLNHVFSSWYRQADNPIYFNKPSLMALVAEDYYFIKSKAQININGSLMSLLSKKIDDDLVSHISLFSTFKFNDITTGYTSVDGKYYILGNADIDFIEDRMINCTFLETSQEKLDSEYVNYIVITKN